MLDRTVYWLFRLAIVVTRPLPLRLGYWFGERVALVCYWVIFPRHRKALNANLAHVLQSNDARFVDSVARRSFRNFGKYVIDFVHFPSITRDEIMGRLRFEQWDELRELREATDAGRGIIIATIHFGNWDIGAAALAAYDYPINAIAETFPYQPMNDLVQGSRAKLGTKVIGHDRMGPTVFKALRRGEMLALLVDVASSEATGIRVDFFRRACARLAGGSAHRPPDERLGRARGRTPRPLRTTWRSVPIIDTSLRDFEPTGDEAHDVQELMRLIMASLEKMIRLYPDQWFIFRRLWNDTATAPASADTLAKEV